jgi:hypothetical protein
MVPFKTGIHDSIHMSLPSETMNLDSSHILLPSETIDGLKNVKT